MRPEVYDAWYDCGRGRWIGETEYRLVKRLLQPAAGEMLLDAGCGTGRFGRRLAAEGFDVVGVDTDPERLAFARSRSPAVDWVRGDIRRLPFRSHSFDRTISIAAIGFIDDERLALSEIVRITRKRFVLGWLNRSSLLYSGKAGRVGYAGCRWHTAAELRALFAGLPVSNPVIRSTVFLPDGGRAARLVEPLIPPAIPLGGLLVVAGDTGER